MLVRHFMTRDVITLKAGMLCREALRLFQENKLRRAPVIRSDALVGMVSLNDLLRILPGKVGDLEMRGSGINEKAIIAQVMTTKLITLDPEEHLEEAAHKMLTHKVGGLPVLLHGHLEGMLTESDIFRAFVGMTKPEGELRVTFALSAGHTEAPDPVLIALRLSFRVRGYLVHERPGGEEIALLRLRGQKKLALIEALGRAGYTIIEIVDTRRGVEERPAA